MATELVAAFAIDGDDKHAAETRFAQSYIAVRLPNCDPTASCDAIRTERAQLKETSKANYDRQQKEGSNG